MRLERLLQAFCSHAFYLLGAGASYGLVPLIVEMAPKIVANAERFPGFPADLGVRNNITFQRVVNDDTLPWSRIHSPVEVLIKTGHFTTSTFDGLWRRWLAPTPLPGPAAQYQVFRLARPGSILFTLNVDGLGKRYCGRRLWVIEAHGSDQGEVLHSKWAEELIDMNMYAEWNHLSKAILNVAHRRGCYDSLSLLRFCSEIHREYFEILERSP